MLVSVNNQSVTLPLACSLAGLADHFGFHSQKGMAIAVNQKIIPKSTWDRYDLS
jgi:thiamine biosynthesis protein ThiS